MTPLLSNGYLLTRELMKLDRAASTACRSARQRAAEPVEQEVVTAADG
jgi:hypothetical protein